LKGKEDHLMKLSQNVGSIDRVARIAIAVALVAVALAAGLAAPLLYVAWAVAAILLVTGTVGFCPLYALVRVSTDANRVTFGRR
jgi:hypothetical protein